MRLVKLILSAGVFAIVSGLAAPAGAALPPEDGSTRQERITFLRSAAELYGTPAEVLVALARLDSENVIQFSAETFYRFASNARAADPAAWRGLGRLSRDDWRQRALAAAWALATDKGRHWGRRYRRALRAAGGDPDAPGEERRRDRVPPEGEPEELSGAQPPGDDPDGSEEDRIAPTPPHEDKPEEFDEDEIPGDDTDTTDVASAPACEAIDSSLRETFNVLTPQSLSCGRKQLLFTAVAKAFSYPGFKQKMQGSPIEFRIVSVNEEWWGFVPNSNMIKLNKLDSRGSDRTWRYIVIHELFHVLARRNRELYREYPYSSLVDSDSACFRDTPRGKVIRTYTIKPPRAKNESFAESGSLFVLNRRNGKRGMDDFREECSNSYDWFAANVF